jgi:uncharacterized protein YciI
MALKTPAKLFVSICKIKRSYDEAVKKADKENVPLPLEQQSIREGHAQYTRELIERNVLWMGGPSPDLVSMNIFAVDSAEEAKKIQQGDPLFISGIFYDPLYFEWIIHIPATMASPAYKERLIKEVKAWRKGTRKSSK